ncbi:deoxyribodipyrimidine photo-lyase [Vibrio bivalvicida]|uniref:Deoxyribodipyrimidine photo-lyase n=1 Tax=Vibrio bivalvicida TaxID=1276888 RepID=A0A177Y2J2_9VIBR|nr:deoxyribodipyrimidine photo-lyase [Vibrio bivalvicida]OAJ95031.1 deoxyribodipyrimidine photolyase [Vibrio bivalvicida]
MKIVWLRRDLRVEDNTALIQACKSGAPVVALYVATPQTWKEQSLAPIQADFIYRRLFELQIDLNKNNIPLYYTQTDSFKDAARLVAAVAVKEGASSVYYNKEYQVNERSRDTLLSELLQLEGIACKSFDDKCLLKPGSVINKQDSYFKVFTPFKRAYLKQMYHQSVSVDKVTPMGSTGRLESGLVTEFSSQCRFDYPRLSSNRYTVETEKIIHALRDFSRTKADDYHSNRDFPAIDGTSVLSPFLAIGALSVRQCMARLIYAQPLPLTGGREVWQSELIWREFYQHLSYFEPKLSKGKSFVSWGDHLTWVNAIEAIEAWKSGNTGYPIIDAAMRQLNETGWMHNRLRMIVASFLIKDLHVDWRIGEQYFMSKLVDGDYPANNGGWQWCASTGCDGQPYFRIFNPITQGKRFDPDGVFVLRWIPELKDVPSKFIHQPWKWSYAKALSYPEPIVDHKTERAITLSLYKEAKEV